MRKIMKKFLHCLLILLGILLFSTDCMTQSGNWIKDSTYYFANPNVDPKSILKVHNIDTNFLYISGFTFDKDIYITQLSLETAEIIKSDTIKVLSDTIKKDTKYQYSIDLNDDMTICSYSWFKLIDSGEKKDNYEVYYAVYDLDKKNKIFEETWFETKKYGEHQYNISISSFKSEDGKYILTTCRSNWAISTYNGTPNYYDKYKTYFINTSDLSKVLINNYNVDKPQWDIVNNKVMFIVSQGPTLYCEYDINFKKISRMDNISSTKINYFDLRIIPNEKIIFALANSPLIYSLETKQIIPNKGRYKDNSGGIISDIEGFSCFYNGKNIALTDIENGNIVQEFTFVDSYNTSPIMLKGKKGIIFRCNQEINSGKCNSILKWIKPYLYQNVDTTFFSASGTRYRINEEVHFFSTILGNSKSIKWNFGDGKSSNLKDPIHIYEKPGKYSVTLEVEFESEYKIIEKKELINIAQLLTPDFDLDPPIGYAPATVKIVNKTQPVDDPYSHTWIVNDTVDENNPYLDFPQVGSYKIQYIIKNAYGYFYVLSKYYKVFHKDIEKLKFSKQNFNGIYNYWRSVFRPFFKDNSGNVYIQLTEGAPYPSKYHWIDVNNVDTNGNNKILQDTKGINEYRNYKTGQKIFLGSAIYDYISSDTLVPLINGVSYGQLPYAVCLDDSGRVAVLKLNSKGDKYDFQIINNKKIITNKPEFTAWFTHTNSLANAYTNKIQDGFYLSRLVTTKNLMISKIDYEGKVIKDYLIPDDYGSQFIVNVKMNQVGNELYIFYVDLKKREIFAKINLLTDEIYKRVLYSDTINVQQDFVYVPDDKAIILYNIDNKLAIRYYDLKENTDKTYILSYLNSGGNKIYWDSSNIFYISGLISNSYTYFAKIEILDIKNQDSIIIDSTNVIMMEELFPNPIQSNFSIKFNLKYEKYLKFSIYDINGLKLKDLNEGNYAPGEYQENFSMNLNEFSSDCYYFVIESPQGIVTKKLIVLK